LGGGSFVQRRILPVLKDVLSIQVTCLHKQNIIEAKQIATQFGIPYAVSSREELLNHPEVEAVLIATPNDCHEEDAIACAQAGKPTLCEKPLAPTSQAIIRMQESFAEHDIPLFVGQSLRFKPAIQKAKELLKEGSLGNLLHIRVYFTIPVPSGNWRYKKSSGGGVLQDVGVHLIDLIHHISGENIASVHAIANLMYKRDSSESEHTVLAFGRLSGEACFSFECSMNQPLRSGFEIIGTKSRIISTHSLRQAHDSGESLCHVREDSSLEYLPLKATNIYADELTHFAQVLRGEVSPLISSSVGLCNQRVIESAYESIHSGQMISNF
ncbi:MAG TPA: Gfo/Idh/MocA family oxidoreductase, partial [Chlamydiales bacterium]|nr:Gfo/Idh/MocA family oxidoreductase [Chlamydiales bacterium]